MADKETRRQRVVPSIEQGMPRVSKAALGNAKTVQSTRVEQRSQLPASKQGKRGGSSKSSTRGKKSTTSGTARKNTPYRTVPKPAPNNDPRAIDWAYSKWNGMEAHQQQQIWSILLR